jgi:hypothetical protein
MATFAHSKAQLVRVCVLSQQTTQTTTQSVGLGELILDLPTKLELQFHFQALAFLYQATQLLT